MKNNLFIPILCRKYIFIHGPLSIAIQVYRSVIITVQKTCMGMQPPSHSQWEINDFSLLFSQGCFFLHLHHNCVKCPFKLGPVIFTPLIHPPENLTTGTWKFRPLEKEKHRSRIYQFVGSILVFGGEKSANRINYQTHLCAPTSYKGSYCKPPISRMISPQFSIYLKGHF